MKSHGTAGLARWFAVLMLVTVTGCAAEEWAEPVTAPETFSISDSSEIGSDSATGLREPATSRDDAKLATSTPVANDPDSHDLDGNDDSGAHSIDGEPNATGSEPLTDESTAGFETDSRSGDGNESDASEARPDLTMNDSASTDPTDTGAVRTPSGVIGSARRLADGTYAFTTPCYEIVQFDAADVTPVERPQVLIDPGHGGDEVGAETAGGRSEKAVNLEVSEALLDLLDSHGISAVLTRHEDYRLSIQSRTALANSLQPEILVSVHHNGGSTLQLDEPPVEVFHQQFSPQGRRLAGLVFEELNIAFAPRRDTWSGTVFTGVQPRFNTRGGDLYGMLRRTTMPAVITEAFYLDGDEGDELAGDPAFLAAEADALLRAIQRFLVSDAPGTGFVDGQVITLADPGSGGVSGCIEPDFGTEPS